jgi:lysozyme
MGCSTPDDIGSSQSAIKVCGLTTVNGIDVYHGDNGGKAINWTAVKAAGIDFAFAKATESTNYQDAMFSTNWAGMKSAGIVRGAYHFFHSDVDPVAQANYFLAEVGAVSPGDLLVLDLETTNGQTEATIAAHAATFLKTVATSSGVTPFLYTSPAFLSDFTLLGAYPLWVANYGVSCPNVPAPWSTYTFWQSTGTGSLSAISGALDLDSFNGTLAQLQALGQPSTTSDAGADAADASDGATGAEPNDDASTPMHDATTDSSDPQLPFDQSGGCAVSRPTRGSSVSALATLLAVALMATRRRRDSAESLSRQL